MSVPEIPPDELARALAQGERVQVLDVRAPHRLANGTIETPATARFVNMPNSQLFALTDPAATGLDTDRPVIAVCGHGNASRQTTRWLLSHGFAARSLTGGMAAWDRLLVPHAVPAPAGFSHLIQFDRIGKGALAYLLVADGAALVVDPPRDASVILAEAERVHARIIGVADTHVHADYLSGAVALAEQFGVPYYLHPADAVYPYDGTPGTIGFERMEEGQEIRVGKAVVRVLHTPGHTSGSVTLVTGDAALTGDFLFVLSIGRPDLAGKTAAWAEDLWHSLERVRAEWPTSMRIFPAHYAGADERGSDGVVSVAFGDLPGRNAVHRMQDKATFVRWVLKREKPAPDAYREMKAINIGLRSVSDEEAEVLESGRNECAVM
ncbi:MAG: MBL fold metallo-hydrolase [Gemmatimonadales bacterium]